MSKSDVPSARPAATAAPGGTRASRGAAHAKVPKAVEVRAPLHATRPAVPPNPQDAEGFVAVLRRGDFRYLWAAQAASQLGDKFLMFTLLIFMYTLSGRAWLQSAVLIAYTLPSVLLSAPAGVYADRHDKRTLMVACNVVRGGLVLLIPLAQIIPGLKGQVWPLIIITLLFSSAGQVFAPAEAASIPSLVSRNQITEATSLFMTTVILTLVLGVPAATLASAFLGNFAPFYVAAALFGVAALAVWRVGTSLRAVRAATTEASSILGELREGLAILRASAALRLGLYQLALALIIVFTVFALGPAYMVKVLARSDQDTYIVLVPATFGLVATAAVLGQRPHFPRALLFVAAVITAGVSLTIMGIVPDVLRHAGILGLTIPLAVVLAIVFGCALGALLIPAFTVLQERTTPESRGRIFGGIFTVINAAVAVPLLLAGVIADLVGVGRAVAALGVIMLLLGVAIRTLGWQRLAVLETEPPPVALTVAE